MEEYIKIKKQTVLDILSTLDNMEVSGYNNINRLFGVMYTLRDELNKPKEVGEVDGETGQ